MEEAASVHHSSINKAQSVNAESICGKARSMWLLSYVDDDNERSMIEVEQLYRRIWLKQDVISVSCNVHYQHTTKRVKVDDGGTNNDSSTINVWTRNAGEKLALILLQSGRSREADQILSTLGYTYRLAEAVLNYPPEVEYAIKDNDKIVNDNNERIIPCRIFDDFLTTEELQMFQAVFSDPNSNYWIHHNYTVEPPSPYCSYLLPLNADNATNDSTAGIFSFVKRLQNVLVGHFPVRNATYCEMWAHNRFHATGHQFHFDSDNEGCTESIQNPICSCIIYLSESTCGGPSIVTNQRLTSSTLATKGWMCHPKLGRLVAFDGKVLHGVIPGKRMSSAWINNDKNTMYCDKHSNPHRRRVSVMFAFWRQIRIRDDVSNVGAAKSFPETPLWARQLRDPLYSTITSDLKQAGINTRGATITAKPITLDHIYESVSDGRPWTRRMGMPEYNEIFQGF